LSECRIICLGNPLMGDDGAGLAVYEALRQLPLPEDVELVEAGTIGLGLLHLLEGVGRVYLIDAVEMGLAPGTVRCFTPQQVRISGDPVASLHQSGVAQALLLGEEMGLLPKELVLFGIQPQCIERREGLSAPVEKAVSEVASQVAGEFQPGG